MFAHNFRTSRLKRTYLMDFLPKAKAIENEFYTKQIKHAVCQKDIHNIAVSGDYGTGKSSILSELRRWSIWRCFYRTKYISFMTFEVSKRPTKEEKEINRKKVQQEIFKQLFYGESINKLPQSRFYRIGKISEIKTYIITFIASLVITLICSKTEYYTLVKQTLNCTHSLTIDYAFTAICTSLIFFFFTSIMGTIHSKGVRGIKVKDLSLDLSEHKVNFEETIDEIIYFFKMTHYKVVILEDLDRFNDSTIYEDLRQLNFLINNSQHIWRKVTFIYALRDTLIPNALDRNKIFDINIPILPFLSKESSIEQIKAIFNQNGIEPKMISRAIKIIARNVTDMRTIKAICNFCLIMTQSLNAHKNKDLSIESIVTLAIIHEIDAEEYSKLYFGNSTIDKIYDECNIARRNKIAAILEAIELLNNEHLIENIHKSFWCYARSIPSEAHPELKLFEISHSGSSDIISEASKFEDIKQFWKHIKENEKNQFIFNFHDENYTYNKHSEIKYIDISTLQNSRSLNALIYASKNTEQELLKQLQDVKRENTFSEFQNISFDWSDSGENNIIKEILENKLVSDDYRLYVTSNRKTISNLPLSIFRANYISRNRSNYDYPLSFSDIPVLIESSDEIDLSSIAFYNHSIFIWCYKHDNDTLNKILAASKNQSDELFNFYDALCLHYAKDLNLNYGETIDGCILSKGSLMSYVDTDFILFLTAKLAILFPEQTLRHITNNLRDNIARETLFDVAILSLEEPETLILHDHEQSLNPKHFLNYYTDYIIKNGGCNTLAKLHIANKVKIKNLTLYTKDTDALKDIVSNNMFEITASNLETISSDVAINSLGDAKIGYDTLEDILENKIISKTVKHYCISNLSNLLESPNIASSSKRLTTILLKKKMTLTSRQIIELLAVGIDSASAISLIPKTISWHDLNIILNHMENPYNNIQPGKRPVLLNTPQNQRLLKILQQLNVLGDKTCTVNNKIHIFMKYVPQ